MDVVKTFFIYVTFIFCCACVIALSVSLGTDYWIVANPIVNREGLSLTSDGKFQGEVNFGLFNGRKKLDSGFGDRTTEITIYCQISENICIFVDARKSKEKRKEELFDSLHRNDTVKETRRRDPLLMIYGLWQVTIVSVALSILFGLVGGIFAVFNSITTPVESITGIPGLYLWNGLAALLSLMAVISWVVQFHLKLKVNVMSKEELASDWDSEDRAKYGYSFFLVIVALVLYVCNIITISIIIKQPWKSKAPKTEIQKSAAGVIMLY